MSHERSKEERAYSSIVTFLEGLIDFHPDMFTDLKPADLEVLRSYYWLGREIDVEDIFEYRRKLLASHPDIASRAEAALSAKFAQIGVTSDPADYDAWGVYERGTS